MKNKLPISNCGSWWAIVKVTFAGEGLLLAYFGEKFNEPNCGSCDVCLEPKERFDGTIPAQKILSCVYRVGERFGMNTL